MGIICREPFEDDSSARLPDNLCMLLMTAEPHLHRESVSYFTYNMPVAPLRCASYTSGVIARSLTSLSPYILMRFRTQSGGAQRCRGSSLSSFLYLNEDQSLTSRCPPSFFLPFILIILSPTSHSSHPNRHLPVMQNTILLK